MKGNTHEEYVEMLKIKNPTVEVVDKYITMDTKITHHCLIHDVYWETTPVRAIRGVGCSVCKKERFRKSKCKTHERYLEQVAHINPDIEVIGMYVDSKTKIEHYCKRHNILWMASPDNIIHSHGCCECAKEKIGNKNRRLHEQYVKMAEKVNSNIIVTGEYIDALTPISHRCKIDGHKWKTTPANILYGTGCPKCAGTMKKTHEDYIKEVFSINPNIEVIEEYVNARTPIKHRCKIDGFEWSTVPYVILTGCGCPQCNESHGEKAIRLWLENNNIKYVREQEFDDCVDKMPLPFDFYLPDNNVAIEYQGKQHYAPIDYFGGQKQFEIQQKHDNMKREYCKNNGIKLLEIPYDANIQEELNNFLFI